MSCASFGPTGSVAAARRQPSPPLEARTRSSRCAPMESERGSLGINVQQLMHRGLTTPQMGVVESGDNF